jgi:hypothetical protein
MSMEDSSPIDPIEPMTLDNMRENGDPLAHPPGGHKPENPRPCSMPHPSVSRFLRLACFRFPQRRDRAGPGP